MNGELSTAKRVLAWCGIVGGVLFAALAVALVIMSGEFLRPVGWMIYCGVLVTDCVFRVRGKDSLRNTPSWRRILFGANLLLVVNTLYGMWHSRLSSGLPVFAAMMVLTMGMLYLALLLAGALSTGPAKCSPPVNTAE